MSPAKVGQVPAFTPLAQSYYEYALSGWRKNPAKVAVVDIVSGRDETVTFAEFEKRVLSFAGSLQTLGVKSQSKIQLYADNSLPSLVAHQAALFCNGSVFAFKPNKTTKYCEYKFQTEEAEIEFVLTDAANYDVCVHQLLADPACRVKLVIVVTGTPKTAIPGQNNSRCKVLFLDQLPSGQFEKPPGVRLREDLLLVSYTSGSTGMPKGVMHSNFTFVNALHAMGPDHMGLYIETDRFLLLSTITYVTGTIFSSGTLACGATVLLACHDVDSKIPLYVQKYKATQFVILECAMRTLMCNADNYPDREQMLASLRLLIVGGTVFPEHLRRATVDFFQGVRFMNVYGATEAIGVIATSEPSDTFTTHVGFAAPNFEIKVVRERGNEPAEVGEPGEVLWRSPQLTLGYWKRESGDDFTADGFYVTGDMGVVDSAGHLSIVGRKKHFIICLDERISPTELEDVLLKHPAVFEAVVVATPHPVVQEAPTAMVVVDPNYGSKIGQLDQLRTDLVGLVASQFCDHKHLHGGVHFVNALDKTDSGKYNRSTITKVALQMAGL